MKIAAYLLLTLMLLASPGAAQSADLEKRIDALLAKMTLEEKLGQMSQMSIGGPLNDRIREEIRKGRWGSFLNAGSPADRVEAQRIAMKESRLGIPLLFGRDVIHGYRTVFPIPLGQSASWNPELIERAARVAAQEASAAGLHWTFAPMLDITRDPRWGRIAETLGEDPYLTSTLGAAMVRGFQGGRLGSPNSLAACAKHYAGYGAAEAGRDYNTTWIPEILLRDVFLPPFRAAKDAGVATFMSAFNDLNGTPASGNRFTLTQVLRNEWKFDGFVVSDWESVTEMINHGNVANRAEAAAAAVNAGVDMEMVSTSYYDTLKESLVRGAVTQKAIDSAVRNILRVKFRMGLFDKIVPEHAAEAAPSDEALQVAKEMAAQSIVMLKNDGALPLAASVSKVAVVGPLADAPGDQMGSWVMDAKPEEARTPLTALREMLGRDRVLYAPGLKNSRDTDRSGFAAAVDAARAADVVLAFIGEEQILSGEAKSRAFLDLPGAQAALIEQLAATGKPVIAVILAGRPLIFQETAKRAAAVLYAWHPGTMGGPAIAEILFGKTVPSGKLTVDFPRAVGQIPIYYSHKNTGRPPSEKDLGIPTGTPVEPKGYNSKYLDVDFTPEYPFGFGLSYTTFEYSNLRVSQPRMPIQGKLTVAADVTNTGKVAGEEIVQLYVRDLVGSVTRPVKELKGFRRVRLEPGQKQTVEFTLAAADLAFHNEKMQLVTEPGAFHVWIGPDSVRGLKGEFEVTR